MGGELGDEDERLITRLENAQYKPVSDEDADFKPLSHQPPSLQMCPPAGQQNSWQQQQQDGSGKNVIGLCGAETGLPPSNG